jgi:SAM-dependent methyltransferase
MRLGQREARFASIYAEDTWGPATDEPYYSGSGSSADNAAPLIDFVNRYIREHAIRSVVDVGCGDFRMGRRIDLNGAQYVGVDIVSSLIDRNNSEFGSENVRFTRLDLGLDPLPAADFCLVKQVLQHFSDAEILTTLPRLEIYEHVIIVNGWLTACETPGVNTDIVTGGFRSGGLYLEASPLHCSVDPLQAYRSVDGSETFRVVRYRGRRGEAP